MMKITDNHRNRTIKQETQAIHEPRSFKALTDFAKTRTEEVSQGLKLLTIS